MLKTGHDRSDRDIRAGYARLHHRGGLGPDFVRRVVALADSSAARLLDVGCGTGDLLAALAARFPRSELHGVDISTARVQRPLRDGRRVRVADADVQRGLPFRAATFDGIFCTEVLEHLKHPQRGLEEIRRVLRPGGWAVITVPNGTGFAPFHRLGRLLPGRWLRGKLLPYEHPLVTDQPIDTCFVYREIVDLVRGAGFTLELTRGYRYFRYLEMLPVVRDLYTPVTPFLERALPRVGGVRFAYNLLLRCRKAMA
ncbi:MAG TPA: methyltransferase domain-containing protein [Methylomirabilota bacterium]